MTPERWKQVDAVFEQALELPGEERPAFFERACGRDEELRRQVESLLESHARAGSFIDKRSLFFSSEDVASHGAAVPAGRLIGSYRIISEIGRGGMGAVYLAERADAQYEKRVAIKLVHGGMNTESVLRHFRNERQILASFDHPNIARLLDGGTTEDGLPYFVMEYVEGVPIDRYCDTHDVSVRGRLKLFGHVCAAVISAHRHAVIHRDIKPSNILVTAEGMPKLLDFGIARILEPAGGEPLVTATGLRAMTPQYASPEQVRGAPVTTASDVYSLGVVLYELLTGRVPYRLPTGSPYEIARAITEQAPDRPSTVARSPTPQSAIRNPQSLRGDLDNIILMALRKEPERRYQSVEQFAEDIRRSLEARPVTARRDTLGYRAAKFVQRNRAATAAAALVLLSLIGGLVGTIWQAQRATAEKQRAERRFNEVRELARSVLFDYHDAIKDLPGATRIRERLVKDALVYLDRLAREAAGDPALQRELAAAYERVGDVRGQAYGANLGDRAGATESYGKALRIREALVAADAGDVQSRRDLAASHRKIGNQLLETSEAARGLEHLRKSLALSEKLVAEEPAKRDLRRDLADIYNDIGLALEDTGDMAGALEQQRKALPLREELEAADPADLKARRDLSVTYVNTGRALYFNGDAAGALEINRKALALREALIAADPTNADYRRLLAVGFQNDGDYRAFLGDTRGALESFRKKLPLDQTSIEADPANAQARVDYAYSSERMGVLLSEVGEMAEALPHFRNNMAMQEKNLANDPENLSTRYKLILANTQVGQTEAKLGNREAALDQCRKAVERLKEAPDDPANTYLRGLRARAHNYIGEAYSELATSAETAPSERAEHWRLARTAFEQSLNVWQDLQSRGVLAGDDARKPEEAARQIARCDAALAGQR